MITNNDIIIYLEDIINDIKNENISEEQKRDLTILYIKNKYNIHRNDNEENNLKYLSLGWYIYNFLYNKNE
jgi:hypothetical protein